MTNKGDVFSRDSREKCPVCLSTNFKLIGQKKGSVVDINFNIAECESCESVFVSDPIHPDHINEIYCDKYFHGEGMDKKANYYENVTKMQALFFEKYDWQIGTEISRFNIARSSNWLDIGCAMGNTLDWARDRFAVSTYGVDVSEYASKIAAERGHEIIGNSIVDNDLRKYSNFFDIVTCYEVLEHLYDPVGLMVQVANLLKPGGLFHYTTGAPPKNLNIQEWHYLRPEVHITFYSRKGMENLFNKCGLKPKKRFKVFKNINVDKFKYYDPFKGHSSRQIKMRSLLMKVPYIDLGWSNFRSRLPIGIKKQ